MLISLVNELAVILIVAYLLTRTNLYIDVIVNKNINFKNGLILVLIFGGFAIYGTVNGVQVNNVIINVRGIFPAFAGLIAGPVVGLGAGLIGGVHRYFFLSGGTNIGSSILTILSGLIGGLIYKKNNGKIIGIFSAVAFDVCLEILHVIINVTLGYFTGYNPWVIMRTMVGVMILMNAVGMGVLMFITLNAIKERANESAKNMMLSELKIAHDFQMKMVPQIFPAFPGRNEFDLYAYIKPAKEVGGDLYDFFFIDDRHLCFLIGDVSDKGISSALFMAQCKSITRAIAMHERRSSPDQISVSKILGLVNEEVSRNNELLMFVTLFIAVLDVKTGHTTYSTAGHNPPFVVENNGEIICLDLLKSIPLGIKPNVAYKEMGFVLRPGCSILLYTDGITEAMNLEDKMFLEAGIEKNLTKTWQLSAEEIVNELVKEVESFSEGTIQSDDITVLALKYMGTEAALADKKVT